MNRHYRFAIISISMQILGLIGIMLLGVWLSGNWDALITLVRR